MSYFTSKTNTPFEHWVRLLFPLVLLLLSVKVFRRSEGEIRVFVCAFIGGLILSIFKTFDASAVIANLQGIERQTNWGNAVAAASPFIFLLKTRVLRSTLLFVVFVTLIISLKRTGFLSAAVLVLAYLWPAISSSKLKPGITPSKIFSILTGAAVLTGGAVFLTKSEQFVSYLMRAETRLQGTVEDGGSGRVGLWSSSIDIFDDASFFELIFGRGFGWFHDNYQMMGFGVESLHNDLIDFLISFGVLGALLYILLVGRVIRLAIAFRGSGAHASFAISLALIFCIYSIFSGVFFYVFFFTPLFVGIGYLEAQNPNGKIIRA